MRGASLRLLAVSGFVAMAVSLVAGGTPPAGAEANLYQTVFAGPATEPFIFLGSGFNPGARLSRLYAPPAGEMRPVRDAAGQDTFVTAASDGTFSTTIRPLADFAGL